MIAQKYILYISTFKHQLIVKKTVSEVIRFNFLAGFVHKHLQFRIMGAFFNLFFLLSKNSSIFPKSYVSFLRIFLKVCPISKLLIHFPRAIINVPAEWVILSNVVSESIFKMPNIAITELINAPAKAIELVFKPLTFHDNLISFFCAVVSYIPASLLNYHSILVLAHRCISVYSHLTLVKIISSWACWLTQFYILNLLELIWIQFVF